MVFLKEALEFSDDLILFQGLKKALDYLAKERGLYVVFLFDRFENYIPSIDDKFFLNLKILRNRVKYNFVCVFAVTRPIEDVLDPSIFGEFHEFLVGNTVYLPVKDDIGLKFRFEYLEKITGKKASEEVKKEIEKQTAGHGKLARLCYESALADLSAIASGTATKQSQELSDLFLAKAQIIGALREIWNFLLPEEQQDVRAGQANEFLEKVGLLKANKVAIPLFELYLTSLTHLASSAALTLVYDPDRNEIKKGDEVISDRLTPSEFRLLRFLLTNKGRICEKDEIIENVWKDSKTQEGVTDQALDQIVYRLRKKVEADPNNPHFIHTVKGRGYKLEQ